MKHKERSQRSTADCERADPIDTKRADPINTRNRGVPCGQVC